MNTIKCRCGQKEKSFKFLTDIKFFIDECCTEQGYDHLGIKKEIVPEKLVDSQEFLEVVTNTSEIVIDAPEVSDDTTPTAPKRGRKKKEDNS